MADAAEFAFVAASVRRAAEAQRRAAEDYDAEASRGKQLAAQFIDLCDTIVELLGEYEAQFADESDELQQQLVLNETRGLLSTTRDLQLQRAWLDAAAAPPIDLGSYYFFSALARTLVHLDSELTVATTNEGSYAILVNPFRPDDEVATPPIVLVAVVPSRETRTGLLHPLLVHEIGHGVCRVCDIVPEMLATALARHDVSTILDDAAARAAALAAKAGQDIPVEDLRDLLKEQLGDWIEEIVCDAVATTSLGVTYLLSFAAEVLATNVDRPGAKHPAPRQRVRLIVAHLDRLGWKPVLGQHIPEFDGWIRALIDDENPEGGDSAPALQLGERALQDVIELIGATIQNAVDARVGEHAFRPDPQALDVVAGLLQQHVPPAQHDDDRAIYRSTIIAGCWLAALRQHGGQVDRLAEAIDAPELARLLPYALELSVLVDRWKAPERAA